MATTKNIWANLDEYQKTTVQRICKAIEEDRIFIVATEKHWKVLERDGNIYTNDWSYVFQHLGVARKARNNEWCLATHKHFLITDIEAKISLFLATANEHGVYESKEGKKKYWQPQVIWM